MAVTHVASAFGFATVATSNGNISGVIGNNVAATKTFTYTATTTANLVLIWVTMLPASTSPTTCSLTATGWTFTQIGGIVNGGTAAGCGAMFAAFAPNTSLATITQTWNQNVAGFINDLIDEFSGSDSTTPTAGNNSATGTGTPTVSMTPTADNCTIWAACNDSVTAVGSIGGSAATKGADDTQQDWTEYRSLTGQLGVAQSCAFTGSGTYIIGAVAILPASSASAPTVTTSAATLIGVSNAVGNGNVTSDGGTTVTERGVVWTTSANPTTANQGYVASGTTGAFSGSVTNLLANTLYHYRAYAINPIGTSYGADTTFTTQTPGSTAETFTSAGSTTWTCPQNVTNVQVEVWGGGGAGARTTTNTTGGAGGGGGGYAKRTAMAVTPGTSYSYTVGAAGANTGTPANGGQSTFTGDNAVSCTAGGGTSPANNATSGGSGGAGTAGDVTATGGTGGNSGASTSGGGGGEGAGASGNGANASGATAGSGVNADGGDGGTGKASGSNGVGGTGSNPGGGGGGSYRQSATSQNGGPGGVGQVKISYTIMEPVPYHTFVMPVIVQ